MRTSGPMARWGLLTPLLVTACVSAVVSTAATARAEPPELQWLAPPECPAATEARLRLDELLPAEERLENALVIRAHIEQADSGRFRLQLTVTTPDRTSRRTLTASNCRDLAEAALVLAALAVKGDVERHATPRLPPETTAESNEPSPAPFAFGAAVLGSALVYGLPKPAFGLSGRGAVGWRSWEATLGLAQHFSSALSVPGSASGLLTLSTQSLELRGCYWFGRDLRVAPCLAARGARQVATTRNITRGASSTHLSAGIGTWLMLAAPVFSNVSVVADAGVVVPLTSRPAFAVEGVGIVAHAEAWALFIQVGMALSF